MELQPEESLLSHLFSVRIISNINIPAFALLMHTLKILLGYIKTEGKVGKSIYFNFLFHLLHIRSLKGCGFAICMKT